MRVQRKIPIKNAVCFAGKTAKKNKEQNRTYPNAVQSSTLKLQIGEILLNLHCQSEPKRQWQVFESKLRRYIDLNYCGSHHHG